MANAITQKNHLHRIHDLLELAPKFDLANFPRLMEFQRNLGYEEREIVLRAFFSEVARKNPRAAAERAQEIEEGRERTETMKAVFGVWAKLDEKAALAWIESLEPETRQSCLFALVTVQVEQNFGNVTATMKSALSMYPKGIGMEVRLDNIFEKWMAIDPHSALREALSIGDPNGQSVAFRGVSAGLKKVDPQTVLASYRQLSLTDQEKTASIFARAVGQRNPQAAMEIVSTIKDSTIRYSTIERVAMDLLPDKRESAFAVAAMVPLSQSTFALSGFFETLYHLDPKAGLAEYARRMDALDPSNPVRGTMAANFPMLFTGIDYEDPQPIAEYLAKDRDPDRSQCLSGIMYSWAGRDLPNATQWVNSLTDPEVRTYAIKGLAQGWARYGAADAMQWIESLPARSERDAAMEGCTKTIFENDPDEGLRQIHQAISNGDQQMALLQKDWIAFHNGAREEAERWLQMSTTLSPAERAALQAATNGHSSQ